MKKIILILFVATAISTSYSQEIENSEFTGENFSLEGALALFKKSNSIEAFEQALNEEENNVNNLDLNNDGETDYIVVEDITEGTTHVLVLSTYLSETEKQDIATIGIEKTGAEDAQLQIEGDTDLYAENTIAEPSDIEHSKELFIPNAKIVVNVWFWTSVRFIYGPSYVVWRSPWRWSMHPKWWKPWKPVHYTIFYKKCAPHRIYYHRVNTRRVVVAHKVYSPRRHRSTLVVHNKRGTTVVHKNKRGNVKAVKVKRTPNKTKARGRR